MGTCVITKRHVLTVAEPTSASVELASVEMGKNARILMNVPTVFHHVTRMPTATILTVAIHASVITASVGMALSAVILMNAAMVLIHVTLTLPAPTTLVASVVNATAGILVMVNIV